MYYGFDIDEKLIELSKQCEQELVDIFKQYEENCLLCSAKVLKAFHDNRLSSSDFVSTTGYGYSDEGRDKLERIYSQIFGTEDALVRPQIMSGTHALSLTFSGLLKSGDTMISISGEPYDSLKSIIGLTGKSRNSLIKNGIKYEQIELINGDFDTKTICERLQRKDVKLVEIQRSRGYSNRPSLTIDKIERVCTAIRQVNKDVIIMVDNCYGDFVEDREPTEVGADIIVGSLMKNLGGGIAQTGGYIVGKKILVEDVAERFSAPCIGKDIGANMGQLQSFYKGLYNAPSVVCSTLKTMTLASLMLEKLGYNVSPKWNEKRADIVQTIALETPENLINFCVGIQQSAAVESYVTPIPGETPGYPHEEIMASGSFTQGSTIELSCDGPLVAPYTAYMQGGLTYEYGKLGILIAINNFRKKD
ncbi:MAG: aminotransferase class I/II-fold pyridoxal phosphate-dependent enzyme [Christensenellales bacterium]